MYPDDAELYAMLRDAIIDELDPPDDDVAEVAILIDAVKKVKQERDQAREAAAHFYHCVQCGEGSPCEEGGRYARQLGLVVDDEEVRERGE